MLSNEQMLFRGMRYAGAISLLMWIAMAWGMWWMIGGLVR